MHKKNFGINQILGNKINNYSKLITKERFKQNQL
jgi:hypothetical protein